jgi:hypothetical protein
MSIAHNLLHCSKRMSFSIAILFALTRAHVVFTPINTVPAGDDSTVLQLEVEHGYTGYTLQSFQVQVPQGVQIVRPADKVGFTVSIASRPLPAYNWYSGAEEGLGGNITSVASMITWTVTPASHVGADMAPASGDIDVFEMQLTLGCTFNDSATNSLWDGNYTLWFPTNEILVGVNASIDPPTRQVQWTGTVNGSQLWSVAKPGPAPYLVVGDWSACTSFTWFDTQIESSTSIVAQMQSSIAALNTTLLQTQKTQITATNVSIASLVLAIFSSVMSCVLAMRVSKRDTINKA